MQTFGLSSSHATSNRNSAAPTSEKPSHTAEHFGDVMHRALNGADAKQNHSDTADSESKNKSDRMKADKKRAAEKKSHHDSVTQNHSGITPAPTAAPSPAPAQSAGPAHDSNETSGTTPVLPEVPAKTEATNAATTDIEATDASSESATDGQETPTAPEAAKPISLPASDVTQELAAQSLEPGSDPANPAETAPTGKSDPQTTDISAKASAKSAPISPSDPHGISAAKQDVTMQKAEKTQKVAGLAEQDLPGNAATGSEELPKGQKLSAKDASHGEKLNSTTVEVPVRVVTSHDSPASTVTAAEAPATSAAIDTRILERTHDIVALHAMRLSEYSSDSLHVVVKPGAGIQLSLELRQSARGIEVHASLHKGDFDQLNRHWPDLQQRLEARGVRVGTLTTAENFTSGSHQQFQQSKQQSPNQDALYAGAFAEFALSGSMTEAPAARAARATAYRGWESWA